MELAPKFNFLELKNNFQNEINTNNNYNDDLLIHFLYTLKEKKNHQWNRSEIIYLYSIFTNVCKLSGTLKLDAYDALHELQCFLETEKNKKKNSLQVLKNIDERILRNLNTTHQNYLHTLPFGLQYILHPNFFYTYMLGFCFIAKWFLQVYLEMVMSVIIFINNAKVSVAQVLYTDFFPQDRAALLSALCENQLFIKSIQAYNFYLQFTLSSFSHFASWLWNVITTLCLSFHVDKMEKENIVWNFFTIHLQLSPPALEEAIQNNNFSSGNKFSFLQYVNKAADVFFPNFFSRLFDTENFSKNTMKAMRLGATPSRDITILMETIHKVTDEGEYIFFILSTCLSFFFLLVTTYVIIYLTSWFMSIRTKTQLFKKIKHLHI